MSDLGIICEVNPLHGGHRYLIESARALGAERVVCVMSGNTVQRGEFAVVDKYCRAEALIRSGADLVLELPFPWSSGSAEPFARGGISLLRELCDGVIFGSECGDIVQLSEAALRASEAGFRQELRETLRQGAPAAEAYYRMLGNQFSSNDLLGVEYIRAISELGAGLSVQTVQRQGSSFGNVCVTEGEYPSASAIRRLWREGETEKGDAYLSPKARSVFQMAREEGRFLDEAAAAHLLLTFFRMADKKTLSHLSGCEGGLANHFCAVARQATDGREFLALCRTKRYTDSHLYRVMLYCLAGVRGEDLESLPTYTTLLGASSRGRELLAQVRKKGTLPIVTKPADAPRETRQYLLGERIDGLYAMLTEKRQSADAMLLRHPYIESEPI